ncbi:hypothetical protein [Alloalcanivorax marinus]|uniref:hypothetical protein n=1 Tax=Alloalcanivorax marinus TaxID=1177169 RepID=UPI0019575326|nr:hypothetical protein [Alloalcanivorax marinus]MBM7334535.1 hypothetical protein [Alloalcanivorax marinus]
MRRQKGALMVVTPLLMVLIVMLGVMALDGARLMSLQKELQSQANAAATAAAGGVQACGGAGQAAMVNAATVAAKAQGFDEAASSMAVRTGVVEADGAKVLSFKPEDNYLLTNGVSVHIERQEPISRLLPESVFGTVNLTADAAARKEVYATFYTESFTAQLSTAGSPLLEPIFQYVLGDNQLNLRALSLEQLAATVGDLEDIVGYIAEETHLGLDEVLGSEVPAYVVVGALKAVDGLAYDAAGLLDDIIATPGIDTNVKLQDVVGVLGESAVDSGARVPLLEVVSSLIFNLAQQPPLNGVIELNLDGLTGALGLDENIKLELALEIDNTPKPVVAPARMMEGEDGLEWMGTVTGADIRLRLDILLDLGGAAFTPLRLRVPIELSTGATRAKLVGARCAAGTQNEVGFDFEVERSALTLSTMKGDGYNGIEVLLLGAEEPPDDICFPAIADWACPVEREGVNWNYKYSGLLGEDYGDCCYPPIEACGRGLLDVQIDSSPVTGRSVVSTPLYFDDLPLNQFDAQTKEVRGDTGDVLASSVNGLLEGIEVTHASLACLPLGDALNFTLDVLRPAINGVLEPLSQYLIGPLLQTLGVDLATAQVHVIAADQPAVELLEYCGPDGC